MDLNVVIGVIVTLLLGVLTYFGIKYFQILSEIRDLFSVTVKALEDGKLTPEEIQVISGEFKELISAIKTAKKTTTAKRR